MLVEFTNKINEDLDVSRRSLTSLKNSQTLFTSTLNEIRAFLGQATAAFKEEESTGSYQAIKKLDIYCQNQVKNLNETIIRLDEKVKVQEAALNLYQRCVDSKALDEKKLEKIVEEAQKDPELLDPIKRARSGKKPERIALLRAAEKKLSEVENV